MTAPTLLAASIAEYRSCNPEWAAMLERLCSNEPDAIKIRQWFQACARPGVRGLSRHSPLLAQAVTCEDWEYEVWALSGVMIANPRLSAWDQAPYKARKRKMERIEKLARELADELDDANGPDFPVALELFDADHALKLAQAMGERAYRYVSGDGCVKPVGITWHPPSRLAHYFKPNQGVAPMLRRLAAFVSHPARLRRPDARPVTGAPVARMFARTVADYFLDTYGSAWPELVTSCVALKFPELDPPVNSKAVSGWILPL